jgi:TolB protein
VAAQVMRRGLVDHARRHGASKRGDGIPCVSIDRQLTVDPAPDWGPDWSPDWSRLAFYSYRTGDRELWVVPATGGPAMQLTSSRGVDSIPRWSPDGREIAFTSERTGNADIWVTSADG